jgi:cytochrome P450
MQEALAEERPWTPDSIAREVFVEDRTTGDQVWERLGLVQSVAPLHFYKEGNFWLVTGYAEARTVLGAPGATLAFAERNDRVSRQWRDHRGIMRISDWYAHKEGEEYSRVRKTAYGFFKPAVAKDYMSFMQKVAREVVAELKSDGGGNVREQVGYRMTTKLTDYLLGLDDSNRPDFKYLIGQAMLTFRISLTEREWEEADAASDVMHDFWLDRITQRMENPVGDDVIAQIIRAGELTKHEIIVLAENILLAGSDTTANTVTNGVALLLQNPDQLARAQKDQKYRDFVADEVLRLGSPGPTTWRGLVSDLDVNGTTLPAGALACVVLGSANRDPSAFPTGHKFDLGWYLEERTRDKRPIPFGLGQHMCLGQYFVRTALGALFDELLAPENTIELDGTMPEMHSVGLRQVSKLNISIS